MPTDELNMLMTVLKFVIFPVVGFAAGFCVKWFLQDRKARHDVVKELADKRAEAFIDLWKKTTLPVEIRSLDKGSVVPDDFLKGANDELGLWYYDEAGALFLSWRATQAFLDLLDTLRSERPGKKAVVDAFSRLRTHLKQDCGIYTEWDSFRKLRRPRESPWPADNS